MNCSLSAYEDFIHTPPNASLWQRAGRGTGLSGADGNRPLIHVPVSGSLRVRAHPGRREGLLGLILHRGQLSSAGPAGPRACSEFLWISPCAAPALLHPGHCSPSVPPHPGAAASLLLPLRVKCCLCQLGTLSRSTQLIQQLLISAGTGAGTEGGTGHLHGLGSFKTWDEVKVGRGWLEALSTIMFNSLRTIS